MNGWILTGLTLEAVMDVIEEGQTVEEVLQSDKWWGSVNQKRHWLIEDVFQENGYWYLSNEEFDELSPQLIAKLDGWSEWEYLSDVVIANNTWRFHDTWECNGFSSDDRKLLAQMVMVANFGNIAKFPKETIVNHIFEGDCRGKAYTMFEALRAGSYEDTIRYALAHMIRGNDAFLLGCMLYDEQWVEMTGKTDIKMPPLLSKYEWYDDFSFDAFVAKKRDWLEAPPFYDWEPFALGNPIGYYGRRILLLACADTLIINHPELGILKGMFTMDVPIVAWYCRAEVGNNEWYVQLLGDRHGPNDDAIQRFKWLIANYDEEKILRLFREHWHESRKQPLLDSDELTIGYYNPLYDCFIVECPSKSNIFGSVFYHDGFYFDIREF